MNAASKLAFNVLVKFEGGEWIAHCLELDIVATGSTPNAAVRDMKSLILTQVSTAIENENMEYLYHPAPQEVWQEYAKAQRLSTRKKQAAPNIAAFSKTIFASAFISKPCHA